MSNAGTILVCGAATRGIGEAVTRHLLAEGHSVFGVHDKEHAEDAQTLGKISTDLRFAEVDYEDRGSLQGLVAKLDDGSIAGFVFAEMSFAMENPDDFDHALWDKSIAINLSAPNFLVHALKPKFRDGAAIVIVTSTEGFVGSFGASAYAATKAAIHNLVKSHANNLGARQIRINAVAPGWIGGVMDTDDVFNMSRRITPLGRLGKAEEVAECVSFLVSQKASFVNGAVLVVDGGYSGVDTIAKFEFESLRKDT